MSAAPSTLRTHAPPALLLVLLAGLPLLSLWGHADRALADPWSELPVKLWCFETFPRLGFLSARMDAIGYPNVGPLNNPDPVGTLVTFVLRPLVGRLWAYNLLVWLQLAANAASAYALAWTVTRSRGASLVAGVAFALTPLTLLYCVTGAVTDMLSLWPYVLAARSTLLALHRPGWRDGLAAGIWTTVGFVACPYNFLVFSVLAVPALPFAWALARGGPAVRAEEGGGLRQLGRAVAGLVVVGGLGVGVSAWSFQAMMAADDSQMSAERVAFTRHAEPYTFLRPGHIDRYTAFLADYVAVGKPALISREVGSRYFRAFSPGISLLALSLAAFALARRRVVPAFWASLALFAAVASTGPFLPFTRGIAASTPVNGVWLGLHRYWPGASLLLEPFRYGLPAALALAICAACGVVALERRWGRAVAPIALVVWLAELVWVSPVPIPLPSGAFKVPEGYSQLDSVLPPGPIVNLPYFDHGTERFYRLHYLYQLVHGRPIPDEVIGFVARYLVENQYTALLLFHENATGRLRVEVTDPDRVTADRARLAADGFVGVVVDPAGYRQDDLVGVMQRLAPLGKPAHVGTLWVYPVPKE